MFGLYQRYILIGQSYIGIHFHCDITTSWGCSTGTNPITDSTTLGLVAKVVESGTKTLKSV